VARRPVHLERSASNLDASVSLTPLLSGRCRSTTSTNTRFVPCLGRTRTNVPGSRTKPLLAGHGRIGWSARINWLLAGKGMGTRVQSKISRSFSGRQTEVVRSASAAAAKLGAGIVRNLNHCRGVESFLPVGSVARSHCTSCTCRIWMGAFHHRTLLNFFNNGMKFQS
jgi:hypothetical protein